MSVLYLPKVHLVSHQEKSSNKPKLKGILPDNQLLLLKNNNNKSIFSKHKEILKKCPRLKKSKRNDN